MTLKYSVTSAYQYCLEMAQRHYENFPVASYLLPRHLRYPIAAIYAFARSADDIADEGNAAPEHRLQQLQRYREQLAEIENGVIPDNPIFIALHHTIHQHQLPIGLFHDLLTAFKQDVTTHRYSTFEEVLRYCQYSANPVGRLLLHLYKQESDRSLQQSDAVCTGLQLINFFQDLAQDFDENNRIYMPQQDCRRFEVEEKHFRDKITDDAMRNLMAYQYQRAYELFLNGHPLGLSLPGRIGFNMRAVYQGGMRILQQLQNNMENVFYRPRLNRFDKLSIVWYALIKQ